MSFVDPPKLCALRAHENMFQFKRAENHETYEAALPKRKPTVDKDKASLRKKKGGLCGNPQALKKVLSEKTSRKK